jgi:hypothetical protein
MMLQQAVPGIITFGVAIIIVLIAKLIVAIAGISQ